MSAAAEEPSGRRANILLEETLTLAQAAAWLPGGRGAKQAHLSTVWRWITEGARRPDGRTVHLEACRLGSRWVTSVEALGRFCTRLTPDFREGKK
jgi:hypothetical protein